MFDLEEKVANGAWALDEYFKDFDIDWRSKIDTETLKVSDPTNCVVSQIFGSYDAGLILLGLEIMDSNDAVNHGFDDPFDQWENLDRLWIEEINYRSYSS